jgi:hypothetical protein
MRADLPDPFVFEAAVDFDVNIGFFANVLLYLRRAPPCTMRCFICGGVCSSVCREDAECLVISLFFFASSNFDLISGILIWFLEFMRFFWNLKFFGVFEL